MTLRRMRVHTTAVALGLAIALAAFVPAAAKSTPREEITADLDGVPITLEEVGKWYCDDFNHPAIHCFSTPADLEARATMFLSVAAIDYVTVYELGSFAGSYMHMSQDYTALVTIGWNDRISSLKGRNSEQSRFFVDWFYGGSSYSVCCNAQVTSLGGFDNTFSSVRRI